MRLAVIPARGGSKRIPRKNIKEFCGKPMIAWAIEAAMDSKCFDKVIVSTDDIEIAEVANQYGASTPFLRPSELSDDHTGTVAVIRHAVEWFNNQGIHPEQVCCIYATAPFITSERIAQGLSILLDSNCDYTFSVTSYDFPVQRAIKITEDNRISMLQPEHLNTRSQDLIEAYHDAGQFYWGLARAWLEERVLFGKGSTPILIPRHQTQDIDTLEDWIQAEWLFKAMQSQAGAQHS